MLIRDSSVLDRLSNSLFSLELLLPFMDCPIYINKTLNTWIPLRLQQAKQWMKGFTLEELLFRF